MNVSFRSGSIKHTLKYPQSFSLCPLVASDNIAGLQTHAEQLLSFLQQLAGQYDDQVGSVSHLGLLLLTGHDEQLSGGVYNVEFAQDRGRVRGQNHLLQVVDDNLIAAIGA